MTDTREATPRLASKGSRRGVAYPKMTLAAYLAGMRAATTAEELEFAIKAPYKHGFHGRTWSQICKVRIEAGDRIVAAHPHAFYIPRFGAGRVLTCCGETYKVGRGHNWTGVRYVWHAAGVWAQSLLRHHRFGIRAAYRMWEGGWNDYPHRSIELVSKVLAGKVSDPKLNVLIRYECPHGRPINYSVERNEADEWDRRATRQCPCGGTLFDWGGGHSEGFEFINWHCNKCPDVFTEYMTRERFYEIRSAKSRARALLSKLEASHG
jgi:hypothetical protein